MSLVKSFAGKQSWTIFKRKECPGTNAMGGHSTRPRADEQAVVAQNPAAPSSPRTAVGAKEGTKLRAKNFSFRRVPSTKKIDTYALPGCYAACGSDVSPVDDRVGHVLPYRRALHGIS